MARFQTTLVVGMLVLGANMPAAGAPTGGETVQELKKEWAARDAVTSDLQRRGQALEEKTGGTPERPAAPTPPVAAQAPVKSAPPPAAKPKPEEPIDED